MPLTWNEIRARAARFAQAWKNAHYEKGQTQTFYNEFFEVFGRRQRDVAVYEKKVKKLNNKQGFIDLFWPGQLLVEQKSAGHSLQDAREQAMDYFVALKEYERPRYILLSDFQTFEMMDLETREEHRFRLADLPEKARLFGFVAGYHQQQYKDQDPANIEAASLMSNLHRQLEESGYTGADLERLLVRIMFCLFADDTAIFDPPDSFLRFVEDKTSEDGGDLGSRLIHLFEILDTPTERRQKTLDEDLARFPYVNGQLFADLIRTPSFDAAMRQALLQCCYFDWSKVSPALFGSLFQTVMLPAEQRKGGAHYTSERNILKTIQPLFIDALREEFRRIRDSKSTHRRTQLEEFQERLGTLAFLDPACGCGNFLILAYRELRLLEIEVLEALYPRGQATRLTDIAHLSRIDVDQFYGIEIEEFPARIAEAAMWLVDHQMNMRLSEAFGQAFVRLPLKKSAHIVQGNALRLDWKTVIAPDRLSYMLGNPPFVGSKYQSADQREDMRHVFAGVHGAGVLDYVAAWYLKAAQYIQGMPIKVAFVSTNSITQGEQAGILWPSLLNRYGVHIHFAHRTFKWTIDEKKAKGMKVAAVYCVIIGFAGTDTAQKYLFDYDTVVSDPHRVAVGNINPYLVDAGNMVITKRSKPLCDVPEMGIGNKPIDGGNYLFTTAEKTEFLAKEPQAEPWFRRWIGADEFINGWERWCLWLGDCPPNALRQMPEVMKRVEAVRKLREKSLSGPTKRIAVFPARFHVENMPRSSYIIVPRVSSERRLYIPIGFLEPNILSGDSSLIIPNATLYHFGVLTSLMHMDWVRHMCGRLESRYRYSSTLVYNNFPWPQDPTPAQVKNIEEKAQAVLDARTQFPGSALADLYDPLTMPPILLKAHQALDRAVDMAYRKQPFASPPERIAFLFEEYQRLTAPLVPQEKKKPRGKRPT